MDLKIHHASISFTKDAAKEANQLYKALTDIGWRIYFYKARENSGTQISKETLDHFLRGTHNAIILRSEEYAKTVWTDVELALIQKGYEQGALQGIFVVSLLKEIKSLGSLPFDFLQLDGSVLEISEVAKIIDKKLRAQMLRPEPKSWWRRLFH